MKREYFGEALAGQLACALINSNTAFSVTPLPWNVFEFTTRDEYENVMPHENVGRDALVLNAGNHAVCKYCGREYDRVEGLIEGDPCPSDDCPSHDMEGIPT